MQDIHVADSKMLVSKNPCRSSASPQREPIMPNASPITSQWNIVRVGQFHVWQFHIGQFCVGQFCVGFTLAMYISCCLFPVSLPWVANTNTFSSEIWALVYQAVTK